MDTTGYPFYYHTYIEKIPEGEAAGLLESELKETLRTLAMVSEEEAGKSYAEGKWSIKELVQHLLDTERIFSYRALSFARGQTTPLPGYDHDCYAEEARANRRSLKSMLEEYKRLRLSTIDLFNSLDEKALQRKGTANNNELSVIQIFHVIIGHEIHHREVMQQKYLS
jgi:uncharacterized damage-inducible protein DinB